MKVGLMVTRVDAATTVAAARAAEANGHDALWLVEDLWHRGAVPLATACALATERIRIGVGVLNPYTLHPTLFAMNYGSLAEVTGGRAVLGMGSSVKSWVEQMGFEHRLPRTMVKESIEIARELLAGKRSSYQGKAFHLDGIKLGFQVDQPTPMFVGAMGERTVRTTGEIADGWIVSILEPAGYVRAAKQWLREGAEQAGRDPSEIEVVQYFPFSCSSDSAAAKAAAKRMIAVFIEGEIELYRQQRSVMEALSGYLETVSPEEYLQVLERLNDGVDPVEAITDALADELSISGTPEECAAQLRRYGDAGVTEAALIPAGMEIEDAAVVLGRDIRPLLAG